MEKRNKLVYILISSLIFLIFIFPHPFFLEIQAIEESNVQYGTHEDEEVFAAVVNSFDLFSLLLQDVNYRENSIYPIVNRAATLADAITYLSSGFQTDFATELANYYLGWDEELDKLVVIPTDSIPIITASDREQATIVFINEKHAVLQRIYQNCYAENDNYIYNVHVQKESSKWKISELSLEEIE